MSAPAVREWLLDAAARIEAALGPSRVERLVLPPLVERPGKEGEFCAVQLDDGSVGLSFTAEPAAFLARVAAGQKWGAASRKVTLVPQRYPGFEALRAAASRPSR